MSFRDSGFRVYRAYCEAYKGSWRTSFGIQGLGIDGLDFGAFGVSDSGPLP